MAEDKSKTKQATPKTYAISSEQLMDIMKYLMTRPYGEVIKIMNSISTLTPVNIQKESVSDERKNNLDKYTGILFELKIVLNKYNPIVIDYGGKPVGKIRDALKGFPYQANLCAAIINHANSMGKKMQEDIKQIIQKI